MSLHSIGCVYLIHLESVAHVVLCSPHTFTQYVPVCQIKVTPSRETDSKRDAPFYRQTCDKASDNMDRVEPVRVKYVYRVIAERPMIVDCACTMRKHLHVSNNGHKFFVANKPSDSSPESQGREASANTH